MCEVQNDLTKLFQSADESNVPEKFPIEGNAPKILNHFVSGSGNKYHNVSQENFPSGFLDRLSGSALDCLILKIFPCAIIWTDVCN